MLTAKNLVPFAFAVAKWIPGKTSLDNIGAHFLRAC